MRGKKPKANKDIKLTAGALDALHDLAGDGWEKTQAAVASRATATDWAEKLLADFKLDHGQSIATLLPYRASTRATNGNPAATDLRRRRRAYHIDDMIFFDDYTENLGDAAHLGVMGVHCPRCLTHEHRGRWARAYARLKAREHVLHGAHVHAARLPREATN